MSLRNAVTFSGKPDPAYPEPEGMVRRGKQSFPLVRLQLVRERDRRQLCRVQDLIRIRVTYTTHQAGIGKSPLQGTIFEHKRGAKRREIARKDLDSSGGDGA